MADTSAASQVEVSRRDFMVAGTGTAVLAFAIAGAETGFAQTAPGTASTSSAAPGRLIVERRGPVLLVGIDRPAQNLLDPPILSGLGRAWYQLEHDEELRVAVLHGFGTNFCMGVDLAALAAAQASGAFPPKDPEFFNPFGLRAPFRTKPVVVAVQGGVKFGGHELFLSTDVRVAAADTAFSQGEVTRGVFPGGGATVRFTREAGWANAMRYMLTGEEWGAEEARRLGLVQDVVPTGRQLDRAVEIARKIAAAAPLGVRATLSSARQALVNEEAALAALAPELARLGQSEDRKEFVRALQEGRQPEFKGR